MNKRTTHHTLRRFKLLQSWYFLVAAVLLGAVCVFSLRNNYQHMVTLRSAVYTADQNNTDITTALNNLRTYVYAHMNTNLATSDGVYPPVQLKYTYDRLVKAESDRVAQANSQLYTQAQAYCQQQNSVDFSGRNRVPCITNYVNAHGIKTQPVPDALYKFDFVSPTWSPDLAGWSMVFAGLCLVIGVILFALRRWVKS